MERLGKRTVNILTIMGCVLAIITVMVIKNFFWEREDYSFADLKENVMPAETEEKPFDSVQGAPEPEAKDTGGGKMEDTTSVAYFSGDSYEYLDLLSYQEAGIILQGVRKHLDKNNIKAKEMQIIEDTWLYDEAACSFEVLANEETILSIEWKRNSYELIINNRSKNK